ncbi:hypothetical protein GDO78_003118 [Eleutherodactylus coqui]|uniref:Uncharacterized protein n=1 Tax=Eleutherodactylus coqui TaxID=57060 RepID=A0A8J6EX98_ELECQ|nr:hypothetical protein GDO78_003118 [Eleutherodactylus coqui]
MAAADTDLEHPEVLLCSPMAWTKKQDFCYFTFLLLRTCCVFFSSAQFLFIIMVCFDHLSAPCPRQCIRRR